MSAIIKCSLSNASEDAKVKRLAFMQAQRYWIERVFQDAKNQCGYRRIPGSQMAQLAPSHGHAVYAGATAFA